MADGGEPLPPPRTHSPPVPESPDSVHVEAVLLLADGGEPLLHFRHVGLLVRFPTHRFGKDRSSVSDPD